MSITARLRAFLRVWPVVFLFASPGAIAFPACGDAFTAHYDTVDFSFSQTEVLAGCQTCHLNPGSGDGFNPYGDHLRASVANGSCNSSEFVAALTSIEGMDSDMDGNSNLVEIVASTQPGWCVSTERSNCNNSAGAPDVPLDPEPANTPPVADAGGPYVGEAGTTAIGFDGSGSSDADGDTLTFAWDFGDGATGDGEMPIHTYTQAGNYQVTLVVNDGLVDSEAAVTRAEITEPPMNVAPVADAGGPYEGEPGVAVTFDGSASSDPNGDALTYTWEFGDGTFGDGVAPTHAFAAEGEYTVTLTVSDGQAQDSATTTATIVMPPANRAPTANAGGPYSGETGAPISFDGTGSSDPDGDALTYRWDFGDGTLADGPTPAHTYGAAGEYEVTLVVGDGEFDSEPGTTTATIGDPAEPENGEALYEAHCLSCHGDPWAMPAVDDDLPGLRRVAGARSCNIEGSIFGTSVFPNGVPEMQFLQGLSGDEIDLVAEYLNSRETTGEQRYVTTCAGCHGDDGYGGRVREDVHGEEAEETLEAIVEEEEMHYLACMPISDIEAISDFLMRFDYDYDDDGIHDDEDEDDDNDGIRDDDDEDDDNDGVSDDDEYEDGTDPRDHDTDDDGLDDGEEREHGTDPKDHDSDDDGVSDGDEVKVFGTDPLVANSSTSGGSDSSSGGGSTDLPLLVLVAIAALLRRVRR